MDDLGGKPTIFWKHPLAAMWHCHWIVVQNPHQLNSWREEGSWAGAQEGECQRGRNAIVHRLQNWWLFFSEKKVSKYLNPWFVFVPKIEAWWKFGKNTLTSCSIQGRPATLQVEATKLQGQLWMLCLLFFADIEAKRHLHNISEYKCPTCIWIAIVPKQHAKRDKDQQQVNKK